MLHRACRPWNKKQTVRGVLRRQECWRRGYSEQECSRRGGSGQGLTPPQRPQWRTRYYFPPLQIWGDAQLQLEGRSRNPEAISINEPPPWSPPLLLTTSLTRPALASSPQPVKLFKLVPFMQIFVSNLLPTSNFAKQVCASSHVALTRFSGGIQMHALSHLLREPRTSIASLVGHVTEALIGRLSGLG